MKTLKLEASAKLLGCATALLLAAMLLACPKTAFAKSGTYVFDEYGVFSSSEFSALESKAEALASTYDMGVYLLVTDYMGGYSNPTSDQRTSFATGYYSRNGLGLGSGKDGIMLVVAVASRDYVTIAYGQGSYSFSDEGIEKMEDAVVSYLGEDSWYGGSNAYYSEIESQLEYYDANDKPYKPVDPLAWIIGILAAVGVPGAVAGGVVGRERAAMKTARRATEASNYLDRSSFVLTASDDQYVNTTTVATPRPKSTGGGGGGWGGGGGGGFSSSGGGKF